MYKIAKNSIAYKKGTEAVSKRGQKVYVNHYIGCGSSSSVSDHLAATCIYLKNEGIAFESGNDAPRGGRIGDWVMVSI